jgi:hypothetical protein
VIHPPRPEVTTDDPVDPTGWRVHVTDDDIETAERELAASVRRRDTEGASDLLRDWERLVRARELQLLGHQERRPVVR